MCNKKYFLCLMIFFFCLGCKKDDGGSNIQKVSNFGFYGNVGWGADFSDDVDQFTNTIWISAEDGDPIEAKQLLRILDKYKDDTTKKLVVDLQNVFFDEQLLLRNDAKDRWLLYSEKLKKYKNKILAFYPMDEPYSWGYSAGVSFAKMKDQLEVVADTIKQSDFFDVPILISYSVGTISLPIPLGFNWVGVDCYGSWDDCDGKSMPEYYNQLKSRFSENHRLVLFADAALRGDLGNITSEDQQFLGERIQKYFDYAKNDPLVTGVFAFIWQSVPSQKIIGSKDLPIVKEKIIEAAKVFLYENK